MEQKIKFAVVGCGHIGKRHAEMISRNESAELVALIDHHDEKKLGTDKYDIAHFTSLDSFLKTNPDVDVINICTPNGFHASQAL